MRVLLAIDESESSAEAAKEVEGRLILPQTNVRVLHVVDTFVPPAAAMLDAQEAKKWDADLIVVGAHGLTGLESTMMGNVAPYVVDHAPCSVEVVRHRKTG